MLENNRPLHILLAEDNLVNQMLAVTLLEKRGHAIVVVANGAEALAALEAECFDVVLMDVQMPEIGGFEATAAIRKSELSTGARIPIIAMTAHAMTGGRERCLEAGMDGYLSKPIRSEELFEAIDSLAASSDSTFFVSPDSTAVDQVLDRSALNSQFGGDLELVQKIIPFFLQDAAVLLARISDSIASRDSRALEHAAHTLKGSVANFHAASVVGAAQHLEDIGHGRKLSGAPQALAVLENEMRRLEPVLIELACRISDSLMWPDSGRSSSSARRLLGELLQNRETRPESECRWTDRPPTDARQYRK